MGNSKLSENSVLLNLMMSTCNTTHIVNKYFINISAFVLLLHASLCFGAKVSPLEKPIESIDGFYLKDIAEKLSENLSKTNNEELGVAFIKVSFYYGFM